MIRCWNLRAVAPGSFGDLAVRDLSRRLPVLRRRATLVHITLPARSSHPAVLHRRTRELVLITAGRATGLVGKRRLRLKTGDVLEIPPRTWHSFATGAAAVEAVCLFIPPMDPRAPDIKVRREGGPRAL